jgi:hypothetical protein
LNRTGDWRPGFWATLAGSGHRFLFSCRKFHLRMICTAAMIDVSAARQVSSGIPRRGASSAKYSIASSTFDSAT